VISPDSVICNEALSNVNKILSNINPYSIYGYCYDDSTIDEFKVSQNLSRFPYTPWFEFYGHD